MFIKVPSLRHIVGGCNSLAPNTFAGEVFYHHQEHPVLTPSRTTKLHPYKCYYRKPTMDMVLPTMDLAAGAPRVINSPLLINIAMIYLYTNCPR